MWLCLSWLQKLTNVRIMKENMRTGNLPANMKKARVIQIIPCKGRPRRAGPRGRRCRRASWGFSRWKVVDHPLL